MGYHKIGSFEKNLFYSFFLMHEFSFSSFFNVEEICCKEEFNCYIVQTHTTCGGWYESQYGDKGNHGDSEAEWHEQIDE
jgi:hypothetical protein